jgi:malate/lactate dehydrogenase
VIRTKNVLIYGCGRTGRSIARRLENAEIYTYRGSPIEEGTELHSLDGCAGSIDYIIVTLTASGPDFNRKTTWEMRDSELESNLPAISDLGCELEKYVDPPKIIVVTNPADTLAMYLSDAFDLDASPFGLHLNAMRYSKILGKKIKAYGYHGLSVPLIKSDHVEEYLQLMDLMEEQLADHVRKNGINYEAVGRAFNEYFQKIDNQERPALNSIEQQIYRATADLFFKQYSKLCNHPTAAHNI